MKCGGDFWCNNNQLTSLDGAPSEIGGDFMCTNNDLTSIDGAPSIIDGGFYININNLVSLKNIHKTIKKMKGSFIAYRNPIKSNVLGLLLIDGCNVVELDNIKVTDIINKYLREPMSKQRMIDCQNELIDAGFDDFAQL
jgi:hypothetical protein